MQTNSLCEPLHFRFYDVGLRVASDDPTFFDLFTQTYAHFQVGHNSPPAPTTVNAVILTKHDTAASLPALWLDDEQWPIANPQHLRDHLFEYIFTAIAAQVRSHILVHAAVVERNGHAILIAGDSQHGKSSLGLGLLRRGFRLLSDELAAIARIDGTVHPFLRKLRATPRSLALAGYDVAPDAYPVWLGKYLIDLERLQPSASGIPTPIGDIIILSDLAQQNCAHQDLIRITIERLDHQWLADLDQIEGIEALHLDGSGNYPTVVIQTQKKVAVLTAVQTLCEIHRVLCLEVHKRDLHQPTFARPPQLSPLSKSVAVLELLRHFQGAHSSVILQQEHYGSATSFFVELADLIQNARCHRLFVGHYAQTLDLICDLCR